MLVRLHYVLFFHVSRSDAYTYQKSEDRDGSLLLLSLLAIPSLILSRPEGFIAAGLAILPFVLHPQVHKTKRSFLAIMYFCSTLAWFGYVTLAIRAPCVRMRAMDQEVPWSVLGTVAMGVIGFVLVPFLWVTNLPKWRVFILGMLEIVLWLMLGALSLRNMDIMNDSLVATWENLVLGAGSWGTSLVMLAIIFAYILLFFRRQVPIDVRFPITAMVPVFFLLAHFRDLAYRVGNGDSLNRMMIEIVPLVVLVIGIALVQSYNYSQTWRK